MELNKALEVLEHKLKMEELLWAQKSTRKYFLEGERNIKFFHALIRKRKNQVTVSLTSTISKIIRKIISMRLQQISPNIITLNQSAFIKERNISRTILLAKELLRDLNTKCRGHNITIKLNIHKAFDTIQWSFIEQVLQAKSFTIESINLIMRTITNNYYFIRRDFLNPTGGRIKGIHSPLLYSSMKLIISLEF